MLDVGLFAWSFPAWKIGRNQLGEFKGWGQLPMWQLSNGALANLETLSTLVWRDTYYLAFHCGKLFFVLANQNESSAQYELRSPCESVMILL